MPTEIKIVINNHNASICVSDTGLLRVMMFHNINVPYSNDVYFEMQQVLYQYINREFYTTNMEICTAYSPNIIQYFNPTEEHIFQYNTIMDFSTLQAMVHLHHTINNNRKDNHAYVLASINECIEHSNDRYNIRIGQK